MESKPPFRSYIMLGAIASVAFVVACVSHEAIGHGGTCLALGGRINVLTSVYFRCSNGGPMTDAAGAITNLAVGAVCWAFLRAPLRLSANWRLFLVFGMAFNLFWGTGYLVLSAVTDTGDWAFVLRGLALEPRWLWRCGMGFLGAVLYYGSLRLVAARLPAGTPLVVPFLSAGILACVAALFFTGPLLPALRESCQEGFGAGVGLLILIPQQSRRAASAPPGMLIDHSPGWLWASAVVIVTFLATLGRGFHHG